MQSLQIQRRKILTILTNYQMAINFNSNSFIIYYLDSFEKIRD